MRGYSADFISSYILNVLGEQKSRV